MNIFSVPGRPVTGGTQRINMRKPLKALPVDSPFNDKPKATTSEKHQLKWHILTYENSEMSTILPKYHSKPCHPKRPETLFAINVFGRRREIQAGKLYFCGSKLWFQAFLSQENKTIEIHLNHHFGWQNPHFGIYTRIWSHTCIHIYIYMHLYVYIYKYKYMYIYM